MFYLLPPDDELPPDDLEEPEELDEPEELEDGIDEYPPPTDEEPLLYEEDDLPMLLDPEEKPEERCTLSLDGTE